MLHDAAMHREQATQLAKQRAKTLRDELTISEKRLWTAVRGSQHGYRFRRQEAIGPYIADFVCHGRRLIVEVDGPHHQWSKVDVRRDAFLRSRGYRVLRFTNRQVTADLDDVVGAIKNYLHDLNLSE